MATKKTTKSKAAKAEAAKAPKTEKAKSEKVEEPKPAKAAKEANPKKASALDAAAKRIPVTASLGVATFRRGDTTEAMVDRADRAMYEAKSNGRNRVVGAGADAERSKRESDVVVVSATVPFDAEPRRHAD